MKNSLPVYDIEHFQSIGNKNDFYANTFTDHLKRHPFVLLPHRHNFFMTAFFSAGSGTFEIDLEPYSIRPGSIFFMTPGQTHGWQLSADINGYVLFHTRDFYDIHFNSHRVTDFPFFCSLHNRHSIYLQKNELAGYETLFLNIFREYVDNGLMHSQMLSILTGALYIRLLRIYIPKKMISRQDHTQLRRLRKLEDLVETNFRTIKSPSEYAALMHISEKQLNRIVKTNLSKNISTLISDRVVLEAKRLLAYSEASVAEIAGILGYYDSAYFSRFFRNRTGMSPMEFAAKHHPR